MRERVGFSASGSSPANPAEFPIGSAESRAAARFLAHSRARFSYVMPCDEDYNPLPESGVRYHPRAALIPRQFTCDEWIERFCPREGETHEEHQARLDALPSRSPEARERWLARYGQAMAAED